MKKFHLKLILPFLLLGSAAFIYSCKKFLDKGPVGSLSSDVLASKAGVDGLLIGAYSMLDGWNDTYIQFGSPYATGLDNSSFGGYGSDDAYKGSNTTDQAPDAPSIENHSVTPSIGYLEQKWQADLNGVQRANDAIREIPLVTDGSITPDYAAEVTAEARFLRGVFEFDLAKIFRNVPYVSETVTYAAGNFNVGNPGPIWDSIEADFTAAMAVLPKVQSQIGRCNYYAAEAFLAKAYMFDHQYTQAMPLLTDLIDNGVTSHGDKYVLGPYEDNFDASHRNNPESVFCIQMTVNDGSGGQNSNPGDILNFAAGTYTSCCGFYQPSYTLANAFKTDSNGLPMFQIDPATGFPTYNDTDLPNDHGYLINKTTGDYTLAGGNGPAFTPPSNPLDPRIDWTMGRYGIPYLDWGLCGGEQWSRGDIVPYNPIKNVFWANAIATTSENSVWGATNQGTAINYNLIRFADVILWRAECEVETGDLQGAEDDVNMVRDRMAAHPEYWVHTYIDNNNPQAGFTNTPAANYRIGLYGVAGGHAATGFVANGQAYAREAVHMERQLEFGMEGHRFFDLQRWDGLYGGPESTGYMAGIMNAHIKADNRDPHPNPVLKGATFTAGKNELYPIPQGEIDKEGGELVQNPMY